VPEHGWHSLVSAEEKANGIDSSPTGHAAVLRRYNKGHRMAAGDFLGFRVVKINDLMVSFSDRSNSLNADKLDQRTVEVQAGPGGWKPSATARMPPQWRDAVVEWVKSYFTLQSVAVDN
jgi:hypothetical protein